MASQAVLENSKLANINRFRSTGRGYEHYRSLSDNDIRFCPISEAVRVHGVLKKYHTDLQRISKIVHNKAIQLATLPLLRIQRNQSRGVSVNTGKGDTKKIHVGSVTRKSDVNAKVVQNLIKVNQKKASYLNRSHEQTRTREISLSDKCRAALATRKDYGSNYQKQTKQHFPQIACTSQHMDSCFSNDRENKQHTVWNRSHLYLQPVPLRTRSKSPPARKPFDLNYKQLSPARIQGVNVQGRYSKTVYANSRPRVQTKATKGSQCKKTYCLSAWGEAGSGLVKYSCSQDDLAVLKNTIFLSTRHSSFKDICFETEIAKEEQNQASSLENIHNKEASRTQNILNKHTSSTENVRHKQASSIENICNKQASSIENICNKQANLIENTLNREPSSIKKILTKQASSIENIRNKHTSHVRNNEASSMPSVCDTTPLPKHNAEDTVRKSQKTVDCSVYSQDETECRTKLCEEYTSTDSSNSYHTRSMWSKFSVDDSERTSIDYRWETGTQEDLQSSMSMEDDYGQLVASNEISRPPSSKQHQIRNCRPRVHKPHQHKHTRLEAALILTELSMGIYYSTGLNLLLHHQGHIPTDSRNPFLSRKAKTATRVTQDSLNQSHLGINPAYSPSYLVQRRSCHNVFKKLRLVRSVSSPDISAYEEEQTQQYMVLSQVIQIMYSRHKTYNNRKNFSRDQGSVSPYSIKMSSANIRKKMRKILQNSKERDAALKPYKDAPFYVWKWRLFLLMIFALLAFWTFVAYVATSASF